MIENYAVLLKTETPMKETIAAKATTAKMKTTKKTFPDGQLQSPPSESEGQRHSLPTDTESSPPRR